MTNRALRKHYFRIFALFTIKNESKPINVYLVLRLTDRINKFFGAGTIYCLQKFFGIILLAISVKLFITNVAILIGE